jgi:hypothetical protein
MWEALLPRMRQRSNAYAFTVLYRVIILSDMARQLQTGCVRTRVESKKQVNKQHDDPTTDSSTLSPTSLKQFNRRLASSHQKQKTVQNKRKDATAASVINTPNQCFVQQTPTSAKTVYQNRNSSIVPVVRTCKEVTRVAKSMSSNQYSIHIVNPLPAPGSVINSMGAGPCGRLLPCNARGTRKG